MNIIFKKSFDKDFKKIKPNEKKRAQERMCLFTDEPNHPVLHNHGLLGDMSPRRTINIGGDLRALFIQIDKETAQFIRITTHSQLYK